MSTPLDTIKTAILGSPFDPSKKPSRQGVVKAFAEMQRQLEAAQAGAIVRATQVDLNGVTAAPLNCMAWVVNDDTNANNGIYRNSGSASEAVWTRIADIPQFFISGINVGEGTANAIRITTDLPVPVEDGRCMIAVPIIVTNTVSPPTVRINGGPDLPMVSNNGSNIAVGGVTAGMIVVGFLSNSKFRLITNQVDAAIVAAAEAAADRAEAAAETATGGWTVDRLQGDGSRTSFTLTGSPGTANNCFITVDNVPQLRNSFSVSGSTLLFTQAPPGDGTAFNIEVAYAIGVEISTIVPADGSVVWAKLAAAIIGSQSDISAGTVNKLVSAAALKPILDGKTSDLVYIGQFVVASGVIIVPFGSIYRAFKLIGRRMEPVTGGALLQARVSVDGGTTFLATANVYRFTGSQSEEGVDPSGYKSGSGTTEFQFSPGGLMAAGGNPASLNIDFNNEGPSYYGNFDWRFKYRKNTSNNFSRTEGSAYMFGNTDRWTHLRFSASSGNLNTNAVIDLYGYKE